MNKKKEFINYVKRLIENSNEKMNEEAQLYWDALCNGSDESSKPMFTDNGKLIMKYLQDHPETALWKARDVAEGLFIASRAVSGAMRKLVNDGFVEKVGQDPVIYSLSENGKNIKIDD